MSTPQHKLTELEINYIKKLRYQTPYFLLDEGKLNQSIKQFKDSLPGADIYYAMKANSEREILSFINNQGLGFEVASSYELRLLKKIGVPAERIIYGTAIKPDRHIKEFRRYGVDRFAFDSEQELIKLSRCAPGSKVYVRLLVSDSAHSVFTMSEKFGIQPEQAVNLLIKARDYGLVPVGLSFNVGSQARNPLAWANGLTDIIPYIEKLKSAGIHMKMIDLGGGFPQKYANRDRIANIQTIGNYTEQVIEKLPDGMQIIVEPGRGIVAESMMLVVTVIGKIKRSNGYWLYLDGGAYNGLLEAMAYQGKTKYDVITLKDYSQTKTEKFILTGPTGDNLDVITRTQQLPIDIDIGDKLIFKNVGAYTTVLTTPFNGFPKPKIYLTKND